MTYTILLRPEISSRHAKEWNILPLVVKDLPIGIRYSSIVAQIAPDILGT